MSLVNKLRAFSPNFNKWADYCDPLPTNERFIAFGWLWMIGTALQRRVWMDTKPVFPNNFMFLVGPPSAGKGCVTDSVRELFDRITPDPKNDAKSITFAMKKGNPLFPLSADSSSFEAFVMFTAKNMQTFRYIEPRTGNSEEKYCYCSPAFILDEVSSIFHKDAQNMVKFLLSGWACNSRYTRDTISRQEEKLFNLCLNMIGGTQPGTLGELTRTRLIDDGFSRRCLMVYAASPSRRVAEIIHTPAQEDGFLSLVPTFRELATLYGQMTITQEVRDWLETTFVKTTPRVVNRHPALEYYYASKILHIKKLAMCLHFSDSRSMTIGLAPFQLAAELLTAIEPEMHFAYTAARDTRGEVINTIRSTIKACRNTHPDGLTREELYVDVVGDIGYEDFHTLLCDLVSGRTLENRNGHYTLI